MGGRAIDCSPSAAKVTAPKTATPRAAPTCLLVEATAAATPACDLGIPLTAA
jgi:hypothetical protein